MTRAGVSQRLVAVSQQDQQSGVVTRAALAALPEETLVTLVYDVALVATLNCTLAGVDPPTRSEQDAARAAR